MTVLAQFSMTILKHCKSSAIKVNFNKNPARVIINGLHGFMVDGLLLDMKLFHRTSLFNQCCEDSMAQTELKKYFHINVGRRAGNGRKSIRSRRYQVSISRKKLDKIRTRSLRVSIIIVMFYQRGSRCIFIVFN